VCPPEATKCRSNADRRRRGAPGEARFRFAGPARPGKSGVVDRIEQNPGFFGDEPAEEFPGPAQRIGRIVLAHQPDSSFGPLTIQPGLRRIAHEDGREQIVEPRVMQVMIALLRSGSAILSRQDLIDCCWSGRIVGDDAINRVISRLRRLSRGLGDGIFAIETINKVGYRLVEDGAPGPDLPMPGPPAPVAGQPKPGAAGESLYLMVKLERGVFCPQIVPRLRRIPLVGLIHGLSGPIDLLIRLDGASIAELNESRAAIAALQGVASASSSVVLSRHIG
jgi:DNA-binding winged helix-turn-helix (wHTH) protein